MAYPGTTMLIETTVVNDNGDLTDPATIVFHIKRPDKQITSVTYAAGDVTRSSTGIYRISYVPDAAGRYHVRVETTTPIRAQETSFEVALSAF